MDGLEGVILFFINYARISEKRHYKDVALSLLKQVYHMDDKTSQPNLLAVFEQINLKSATPFPKCYLHKEKWTFDS